MGKDKNKKKLLNFYSKEIVTCVMIGACKVMIQTWIADVTSLLNTEVYQKHYDSVPLWRQEKADKIRFDEDKALSVGAWVLYEKMKKAYHLKDDAPFNLSHSGNYVLCSVEDSGDVTTMVGCDLEKIKEPRLKIARRFFCENECRMVEEDPDNFFRFWVLKESFMKVTRLGLKLGLDTFEIDLTERGPVLKRKPDDIEGEFYFKEYGLEGVPYRIAVCANRNDFAENITTVNL